VSSAAARTPGVLALAGSGKEDGAGGSSPENAAGKLTPAMIVATRAKNAGGRGAMASSVRSTADRLMAADSCGLGIRPRLSPRNHDTDRTASAEKTAPA